MAILLMTAPIPAQPLIDALRAAAPDVPVWAADAPHDPLAVEAILAWRLKPGALAPYRNLRVLCATGAGVDKLLAVPDLLERFPALPVTRTVDAGQHQRIAQYVLACALSHLREQPRYQSQQAAAHWARHPVRPLAQCRIGVLGLGAVGGAIAQAFLPLGFPVAGWARSPRVPSDPGAPGALPGVTVFAGEAGLPALLAQTDVLVCALPLTPATQGLLNRATLAQLPPGAYVINIGRGEQLVEADLRALLDAGHLAGAALDVFEREPPLPDNWVWQHPRVRATPHIAGEADAQVVVQQLLDALHRARAGLPQPLAVDRSAGY
jgi:D-3-phosphoglycerate dehydrogenase/glyoxylate/hydroxypyruvate reductase A